MYTSAQNSNIVTPSAMAPLGSDILRFSTSVASTSLSGNRMNTEHKESSSEKNEFEFPDHLMEKMERLSIVETAGYSAGL